MPHPDEGTIHAWLDGALDDAESARLESHVRECAACGALVAEARGLVAGASRVLGVLDGMPGDVIPGRWEPVAASGRAAASEAASARVIRRSAARASMHARPRWMASVRAAAALLLVAGGTAVVMRGTDMRGPTSFADTSYLRDTDARVTVDISLPPSVVRAPASPMAASPMAASAGATVAAEASGDAVMAARAPAMRPTAPAAVAAARAPRAADAAGAEAEEGMLSSAQARLRRRERVRPVAAPLALRATDSLVAPLEEATVVVGVVRDEHTGEPVAGASILLDNGDIGTLTDHLGRFTITGATTGIHRAQVRRMGYAAAERDVRVTGDSAVVEVHLQPSAAADVAPPPSSSTIAQRDRSPSRRRVGERSAQPATGDASAASKSPIATPPAPTAPAAAAAEDRELPSLATRAPSERVRRPSAMARRDAPGRCLVLALRPAGYDERGAPRAGRTVTVQLLPTVSRDTAVAEGFALRFPRATEGTTGAHGSWTPIDPAAEGGGAGEVYLHWVQGRETMRVRLAWAPETLDGIGAVRAGGVGLDVLASATRVACHTVR
jgi:hypothetical protein